MPVHYLFVSSVLTMSNNASAATTSNVTASTSSSSSLAVRRAAATKTRTKKSKKNTNGATPSSSSVTLIRPPPGDLDLPHGEGHVHYVPHFLSDQDANTLFTDTVGANSWQRTPIKFFGKSVLQPRDTAFFGTKLYSYSDERRLPTAWHEDAPASTSLKQLAKKIERYLQLPNDYFNVVLANKYHHGQDFMGWHSDNEKSLGHHPTIASVSVGAERRFLIKRKSNLPLPSVMHNTHSDDDMASHRAVLNKYEYILSHGSLLVMSGEMQTFYQHSLPKVAVSKCNEMRLNFTFRHVVDEGNQSKRQP